MEESGRKDTNKKNLFLCHPLLLLLPGNRIVGCVCRVYVERPDVAAPGLLEGGPRHPVLPPRRQQPHHQACGSSAFCPIYPNPGPGPSFDPKHFTNWFITYYFLNSKKTLLYLFFFYYQNMRNMNIVLYGHYIGYGFPGTGLRRPKKTGSRRLPSGTTSS